jgi:hypothetical protein
MDQRPLALVRRVQEQQLEQAQAAHELSDRGQTARVVAQLAMHGRQRKKDRGQLAADAPPLRGTRAEEEFGAVARVADASQQVFDAVHGTASYAPSPAGDDDFLPRPLVTNSPRYQRAGGLRMITSRPSCLPT